MSRSDQELFQLANDFQEMFGLRPRRASLGDINGRIDEPGRPGYVRVRFPVQGGFSEYVTVLNKAGTNKTPGTGVIVGKDVDSGEIAALRLDFQALLSQGTNPTSSNPADPNNTYFITQMRLVTFVSHPVSSAANSMLVAVQTGTVSDLDADTFTLFPGEQIDLTAYIPGGGGEWCLACLFWEPSGNTIEVFASTPKISPTDLGMDDINECFGLRSTGSLPIWAWQLYNGQTGIAAGAPADGGDDFMDLRPLFFMLQSGGSGVTDVTATSPLASSGGATPDISLASAVPLALGGTHADLSATGGANQFLKQSSGGANVTVGTIGTSDLPTVPISKGGTGQTAQTAAFDALSPTTTKGDIIADDGTDAVRLAVGSDGKVLTADSSKATGLDYKTPTVYAPTNATYITQTPSSDLSAEQALSALNTGLMKVTTTTGVISSITDSAGLAGAISDETGSGALVFGTAPTLGAPVITDFTSAQHDHLDADDGGTLDAAAIASGVFTKGFLADAFRQAVRVAALVNVSVSSAPASIDTITLASGDRVLLTAQSTGSQNGIWVFNGTSSAMTRPVDYAAGSTVLATPSLFVIQLTSASSVETLWRLTTTGAITIDSTATAWETPLLSIKNGSTGFSTWSKASILIGTSGGGTSMLAVPGLGGDGLALVVNSAGGDGIQYGYSAHALQVFGSGADGNATISAPLSLTRDMYYGDLTISAGAAITTNGYRVFVSGTLDISAAPASWIVANGNNASGTVGGLASTSNNIGGGSAGASSPGTANTTGIAGTPGDTGGNGGNGGRSGGTATTGGTTTSTGQLIKRWAVDFLKGIALLLGGSGGTSGTTGSGGGSGGGGGGGGIIYIAARTIARGTSTQAGGIVANGGNGGNATVTALTNGSGGGGGGGGGWVYVVYNTITGSSINNHIRASGGTGGNGANAGTTGGTGGTGGAGGRISILSMIDGSISETAGSAGTAGSANSGASGGAGGAGNTFQAAL